MHVQDYNYYRQFVKGSGDTELITLDLDDGARCFNETMKNDETDRAMAIM